MEYVEDEFCNKSLDDVINCSIEYNKHLVESRDLKPEAIAVPLTFALIFLVGVTGNVLLILNFARHKKLSTPHNALVVNLAAGDLLMLVIGLPFNSVWYTVPHWPFGDLLCRLSRFAETFATAVTIATLTVLSVERFFIVTGRRRHHQPLLSIPVVVVVVIWVLGFVIGMPDLISATIVNMPRMPANSSISSGSSDEDVDPAEFCFDYNPDWGPGYPKVNITSKFLLLFLLPLLIIAPCYLALAFHLVFKMFGSRGTPTSKTPLRTAAVTPPVRDHNPNADDDTNPLNDVKEENHLAQARKSVGSSPQNNVSNSAGAAATHLNNGNNDSGGKKRKTPTRKRRRLALTVLGLVFSFVLCWLPRHIFLLWFHFDPGLFNAFWHVFKIVSFCLMFSNSAVNPFVFYVLDLRFRAFVHAVMLCRKGNPGSTGGGGRGGEGGGGNGETNPDTMAVEMSVTEVKRTYVVMSDMPSATQVVDDV